MTGRAIPWRALALAGLMVLGPATAASALQAVWYPGTPRVGDVVWLDVRDAPPDAVVEGTVAGRPLTFYPSPSGHAALLGIDVDDPPGPYRWQVIARRAGHEPLVAAGVIDVAPRQFHVQHLTLPPAMVDLDPETERRAIQEGDRLASIYRMVTPTRLWAGPFVRPVAGSEPGTGFGARRVINGQPRAPHTGVDYAGPRGAPVLATNGGRVALVADFFFPGRLVVLDHGLGLYSLYFHLDHVSVVENEPVRGGQPIGTVGATGRATGPHLHFGIHIGGARLDPATLLSLPIRD